MLSCDVLNILLYPQPSLNSSIFILYLRSQNTLFIDDDDTDFRDKRLGIWENDIYDTPGLDWIIGKTNTPTEGTGPHADHTTKEGTQ